MTESLAEQAKEKKFRSKEEGHQGLGRTTVRCSQENHTTYVFFAPQAFHVVTADQAPHAMSNDDHGR